MAKIGLNNFRYGILLADADGVPTYAGAIKPAKAISCSVSITNNEAKLFADDALAESDTSFQSGTVTFGIDDEDQITMATLLGHQVDANGEMVRNSNDSSPYIGFGRVIVKMIGGVYKYKVEFLNKVKCAEPSQEDTTKGENLEFATSTIEGQVATLSNGDWSKTKTFDTKAEAIEYLESLLGGAVDTYTVTYDLNGGTGSISPVTVIAGQSVTLPDGTGITPPEGKTFLGWALSASAVSPTITSPYTPPSDKTVYAVYGD